MIRKKKLADVIRPFLDKMALTDEVYGQIVRRYSPHIKCLAKVRKINYRELCKLEKSLFIIQNGKIFDTDVKNCFHGACESIGACYQINPFNTALVIAEISCNNDSFQVFEYTPSVFDAAINLPYISCFKYLFEYFNVYKLDGSLAGELEDLYGETEVIAISKQYFHYDYRKKDYHLRIILRWYEGCMYAF